MSGDARTLGATVPVATSVPFAPMATQISPESPGDKQSWYDALWLIASLHPTAPALQVVPPPHAMLERRRGAGKNKIEQPAVTVSFANVFYAASRVAEDLEPHVAAARSAGRTPIVAAAVDRGFEFVVVLFAASKLGARTLPLPPEYPPNRRRRILELASPVSVAVAVAVADTSDVAAVTPDAAGLPLPPLTFVAPAVEWTNRPFAPPPPPMHKGDCDTGGVILSSSGSTGEPKLISRSERSFRHRLAWTWSTAPFPQGECGIQKSHATTTHALYELLEPLLCGRPVYIVPDVGVIGVDAFWRLVSTLPGIRRVLMVPSLLSASTSPTEEDFLVPQNIQRIVLMGERPDVEAVRRLHARLPETRVVSVYGCTEASSAVAVDVTDWLLRLPRAEVEEEEEDGGGLPGAVGRGGRSVNVLGRGAAGFDDSIHLHSPAPPPPPPPPLNEQPPLGTPLDDSVRVVVLEDGTLREVTTSMVGSEGTLHFAGPHLFDGYLGADDDGGGGGGGGGNDDGGGGDGDGPPDGIQQSNRVVGRLYNTRDRVKIMSDGSIAFVGRTDDVVKVRGFRVQLGEIEHHIASHEDVISCAAFAVTDDPTGTAAAGGGGRDGGGVLVAFACVPADLLGHVGGEALRARLAEHLPGYSVPRHIFVLRELPLTASGKVDRKALLHLYDAFVAMGGRGGGGGSGGGGGGGGGGGSVVSDTVKECIADVTGVTPVDSDRLGNLGLDSMSVVMLNAQLRRRLGANVPDGALLQNPTVAELISVIEVETTMATTATTYVASNTPSSKPKDKDRINLDAIFGLRFVLAVWIMRGHINTYCSPGGLQDTMWHDAGQFWRTVFFMIIGGATMSMQFGDVDALPSTRNLVVNYVLPLFPVYWIGLSANVVTEFTPCSDRVWHQIGLVINTFLGFGLVPIAGYMGHCWYLTSQIIFVLMFRLITRTTERCNVVPWDAPVTKGFTAISIMTGIVCMPRAIGFLMFGILAHIHAFFRVPTFVMGFILGQTLVRAELSPENERKLAICTDVGALLIITFSFTPGVAGLFTILMIFAGEPFIALMVFGICKSNCYTSRILSSSFISGLGSLSYGVYIMHPPIIFWARKVYYAEMKDWHDVLSYDYYDAGKCMERASPKNCVMWPFTHVTIFALVLCLSHVLNELVHRPFQKLFNRTFAERQQQSRSTYGSRAGYDRMTVDW